MFQWTSSDFFLSTDFLAESLKAKITHFTIKFRSKDLTHFTNLKLLDIENKILLQQHSQKSFSLYKFSSKYCSGWCQKKHLHCTISRCPRIAFSKHFFKQMSVYVCVSP